MTIVKEINHDASQVLLDFYDSVTDADGALAINNAAALNSTTNGIEVDCDAGTNNADLEEAFTALVGNDLRWRIRLKLSPLTTTGPAEIANFLLKVNSGATTLFTINLDADGADSFIVGASGNSDEGTGQTIATGIAVSASDEICLEIKATKEVSDGSDDGTGEFFVNGVSQGVNVGLGNFNNWESGIDTAFILFVLDDADLSGSYYFDEWILDDDSSVLLCPTIASLTFASMSKPASIDASGTFIYVALLQSTFPILTKISTALDANGTTVFNPGAGNNIGVECGRFDANVVWIAGVFDGTNRVEKSEDGTTFTVKDDGTFSSVETFKVGPDSDDRVLVIDDNVDIRETIDSGTIWTTIASGLGIPLPTAVDRLDRNVQEAVIATEEDTPNNVNYTVNSGANLEDIEDGTLSEEEITGVIVN